jgi:hypothetical protein
MLASSLDGFLALRAVAVVAALIFADMQALQHLSALRLALWVAIGLTLIAIASALVAAFQVSITFWLADQRIQSAADQLFGVTTWKISHSETAIAFWDLAAAVECPHMSTAQGLIPFNMIASSTVDTASLSTLVPAREELLALFFTANLISSVQFERMTLESAPMTAIKVNVAR